MVILRQYHSSLVTDHLFSAGEGVCVICLYCDYRDQEKEDPANMIGAILKQALVAMPEIPDDVLQDIRRKRQSRKPLGLENSLEILARVLRSFQKTYICIDALDECNSRHRRCFLESLGKISKGVCQSVYIFVTGRPHVGEDIHQYLASKSITIQLEASGEDIAKYIAHEIQNDDNDVTMDDDFKKEIAAKIVSTSQGMFVHRDFPQRDDTCIHVNQC